MSFTELAKQAGLSVSAVHQRVRRLEQDGVIRGYVAVFDPDDVGLPLTAFVSIKPFDVAAPDDLPNRLEHLAAIEACHSVAGDENYILKVRVSSPTALEDLLQQIRTIGGVSTRTTVVLSTPYENPPPPISPHPPFSESRALPNRFGRAPRSLNLTARPAPAPRMRHGCPTHVAGTT